MGTARMFRKLRNRTKPARFQSVDNHSGRQWHKVAKPSYAARTYSVPKGNVQRSQMYATAHTQPMEVDASVPMKQYPAPTNVPAPTNSGKSNPIQTNRLPLYRGKKFELLTPGELKDAMSHCLYCSRKLCNPSTRFSHLLSQHHQEHYKNIINNQTEVVNAYSVGKTMGLTSMQQEAYIMATLETAKVQAGTPLDRIHNDVVFNGKEITPIFFSMLLNMVRIKDDTYARILKILTHSINVMTRNSPILVRKFFQSDQFFQQIINTNMIIDELWMLRKEYPEQVQELKIKHRQIFMFRSNLLKFLAKQFGRGWTQNLLETAEKQRVRTWPMKVDGNKY